MRLFRRSLPLEQSSVRLAAIDDLAAIQQLFRLGGRRYFGFSPSDLASLLATAPAVLLIAPGGEVWGVMLSSWKAHLTSWLRGFALTEGITAQDGIARLLPLFSEQLRTQGLRQLYYAGDDSSDHWLQPALQAHGFVVDTEVVVYEKRELSIPAAGSMAVRIRDALPVDLGGILALDMRCFDDQWVKGGEILGPAISEVPFFVVAELNGKLCGYSFATSHFGGRLLHLVRIAVDPDMQGRGIGVRMLAELVELARHCEAEVITLNTQADNLHAQRLYQWFGFQPTGERQGILRLDL